MKGLSVTKNAKETNFEGVWGELESNKRFPETIPHKIFDTNFGFHMKYRTTGIV